VTPPTAALKEQARRLLLAHELTNASLLWVLEHEQVEDVLLDDEGAPGAVALVVRPRVGDWQKPRFPELRRLWLEARDAPGARAVLRRLPGAETFYARLHRRWLREVVAERYEVETGYEQVYFRGDVPGFRPRGDFEVVFDPGAAEPEVLALVEGSGRTATAARRLAERCGGVYVARLAGTPTGVCCVNAKTRHVSEIQSVYVLTEARRRGVGQSLVSAATEAVLAQGRIPTYCTRDTNLGSQALVCALGFEEYQRVGYAVARPSTTVRG